MRPILEKKSRKGRYLRTPNRLYLHNLVERRDVRSPS